MKKALLSMMLILSCLWFPGCDYFAGSGNQETKAAEESSVDSREETTETTAEETEPPIGLTPEAPIPYGEYAEIPASKGTLTMRVLEVIGHTGDIVVKMNLTVENLKPNTRVNLYGSDFELFCSNGRIVEADYGYEYNLEQKYYLGMPNVYDVTMGGDGSVDFYVSFRGNAEDGKILIVSYANNKYMYFALT